MCRQRLLQLVVLAGLLATSLPALADHHMMPGMPGQQEGQQKMMDEFYKAVDATDAQKTQLNTMHQQFETQMKPLQDSMRQKKKDLMTYMASPQANQAEAMRREAEITELQGQMGRMKVQHMFQKKAVLTPEQQQKASVFMQQKQAEWHKERMETHPGMPMPGGPGGMMEE